MKHLIEKRNDSLARIEEILALVEAEQRPMTEEEMAEVEALKAEVEGINKQEEVVEATRNLKPVQKEEIKKVEETIMERSLEVRAQEEKLFVEALREGNVRALNAGTNGALIPETVADKIVTRIKEISPLLKEAQIVNVKGNYRVIREASSATEAQYVEEGQAIGGTDSTFEAVVLRSFILGALVKVSNSLINNTELDVVGYVVDRLAKAIAEKLEREILVGTEGKIAGISKTTNVVTVNGDLSIDNFIDLQCEVLARPEETMFVLSRDTYKAVRKMKDAVGQPYLLADASKNYAETLLGARVCVSDVLEGTTLGYLVDPKAVVVKYAKDMEIKVLNEKFADIYATGVIGYVEADATYENEQLVGKLVSSARAKR